MKKKLIEMQKVEPNNKKPSATDVSKPKSTGFLTSCGLVTLPLIQYASGFMTMMLLESQKEYDHCLSTQSYSSRNHTQRGRGLWAPMSIPATNSSPVCSEPCKDSCNELATIKVATYLSSFVVLIALVMHTINSISCNEKKQACKDTVTLEAQESPDSSTPLNKSRHEESGPSTLRYV
jgi:hypothetical protein